ncbi:hypothetical protein ABVT39_026129 [Epinephelus coioides]
MDSADSDAGDQSDEEEDESDSSWVEEKVPSSSSSQSDSEEMPRRKRKCQLSSEMDHPDPLPTDAGETVGETPQTEEQCRHHVSVLLDHIQEKKCSLQPAQATQLLGMWQDARAGLVTLSQESIPVKFWI